MLCYYLDDAGNTGADLDDAAQPIHYNGALMFPEAEWSTASEELKSIRTFARKSGYAAQHLEFHGVDLFHPHKKKQADGWARVSLNHRLEIYANCLTILVQKKSRLRLAVAISEPLKWRTPDPHHPHAIAMTLCLERIASYARYKKEKAFVVADDCSPSVKQISRDVLSSYREKGAPYGRTLDLSPLIDTIHFMNSGESPHIQLCDLALYAIRRFEAIRDKRIEFVARMALGLVYERRTIP